MPTQNGSRCFLRGFFFSQRARGGRRKKAVAALRGQGGRDHRPPPDWYDPEFAAQPNRDGTPQSVGTVARPHRRLKARLVRARRLVAGGAGDQAWGLEVPGPRLDHEGRRKLLRLFAQGSADGSAPSIRGCSL